MIKTFLTLCVAMLAFAFSLPAVASGAPASASMTLDAGTSSALPSMQSKDADVLAPLVAPDAHGALVPSGTLVSPVLCPGICPRATCYKGLSCVPPQLQGGHQLSLPPTSSYAT